MDLANVLLACGVFGMVNLVVGILIGRWTKG